MSEEQIKEALENIQYLVMDVNIAEIASHAKNENLSQLWISAWRGAIDEQINSIKEALK